jgi:hypothetical protein
METYRVVERSRTLTDKDEALIKALVDEQHRSKKFEISRFELVSGHELQPLIRIVSRNLLVEDRSTAMYHEYLLSNGTKIKKALAEFLAFLKEVATQSFLEPVDSSALTFDGKPITNRSQMPVPMLASTED